MKLTLDKFADNPIIDELLCWWDSSKKIVALRASAPLWRRPFIEISYAGNSINHMHFPREMFIHYWSRAVIILDALTDIKLESEFKHHPVEERETLEKTIASTHEACIRECEGMFESGFYKVYLDQFGSNCKNLPEEVIAKLEKARSELA